MDEEAKIEEIQEEERKLPEKPLDKMTAVELRELAMAVPGVTGVHAMKKEELLVILKEFYGIEDEEPVKRLKKVKPDLPPPSVLKAKLNELRSLKVEARNSSDKKKVDIMRRRINRLKKLSRRAART